MTRTSELFAKVFAPFNEMRSYALLLGAAGCGEDVRFVMMTLATILLGLMTLSLYLSIGDRPLSACAAFVFALGFAARMAVSFSPTVVESGERTMLPLYGAMMLCALLLPARCPGRGREEKAHSGGICCLCADGGGEFCLELHACAVKSLTTPPGEHIIREYISSR